MSQLGAILKAARTAIAGLGLTPPVAAVVIGRLPFAREGLGEELPRFVLAPLKPESVRPFASEDQVEARYRVAVALIAAGDHQLGEDGLDTFLGWRERARRLFQFGCPGVPQVILVEVQDGNPLDAGLVPEGYDYSALVLTFRVIEPRT